MIAEKSSSRVYHIAPLYLRNLGMERRGRGGIGRHRDNAYDGKEEFIHLTREQKEERYDVLKESIDKDGFNEEFPILIMLRRENNADQIFEGHHRLNIAIELGLETVPVRFIEWQKEYNAKGRWENK
jgi:hypothetical protein|tara:strand:- start:976 stop:1356 length:381 start_codon:yes stop_codon:yes gene_type:complete